VKHATPDQAEAYATKLRKLVLSVPTGWGLYCMDGDLFIVDPETHETAQQSDITRADQFSWQVYECGRLNGGSGGW
jgi:hypothetical protein